MDRKDRREDVSVVTPVVQTQYSCTNWRGLSQGDSVLCSEERPDVKYTSASKFHQTRMSTYTNLTESLTSRNISSQQ